MSDRSRIGFLMAALVAVGALATSCSVVSKVKQDVHTVESNKSTMDSFTQGLQSTKDTAFEATYTTTGDARATILYAVDPSSGGLAFHETQTGSNPSNIQLIVNSSGEYKSSSPSASVAPGRARSWARLMPPPTTRSSTFTPRRTGSPP